MQIICFFNKKSSILHKILCVSGYPSSQSYNCYAETAPDHLSGLVLVRRNDTKKSGRTPICRKHIRGIIDYLSNRGYSLHPDNPTHLANIFHGTRRNYPLPLYHLALLALRPCRLKFRSMLRHCDTCFAYNHWHARCKMHYRQHQQSHGIAPPTDCKSYLDSNVVRLRFVHSMFLYAG